MKTLLRLVLALTLLALPGLAIADDGEGETTGKAQVGGFFGSLDDSADMVAEYEAIDDGPFVDMMVSSHQSWGTFEIDAHIRPSDDNDVELSFDIGRWLRSKTTYTKMLHRLGHDPMTNLEATSTNGKVVFHEDWDPMADYTIRYSLLESWNEFQFPDFSALTLAVGVRDQHREGKKQSITMSHCDTCHATSQTHKVNEHTTDGTLAATVAWNGGSIGASYTAREHRQLYASNSLLYDDALHPELRVPVFDNRLQYDSAEGPQAVDMWPDNDKNVAKLNFQMQNVGGFAITAGGVWSETENLYTGFKADYSGYVVTLARRFGDSFRLRWRGRIYSIDNDDVWVESNDRPGTAGPHAGLTYEDVFGFQSDYWRMSALNRDGLESDFGLSYRLSRTLGTLKFEWKYDAVDRESYMVLPGQTETKTNILGVSWRARPAKGWKLNARYRHADIDNPFMLINGACSTMVSGSYPNPWDPETPQYFDFQDARIAETTASPASWDELKLGAGFTMGKTTFNGSYRWWDGTNTEGDLNDWSRNNQSLTLTVWSAPSETWDWYMAYAWLDSQLDTHACIPIFDG